MAEVEKAHFVATGRAFVDREAACTVCKEGNRGLLGLVEGAHMGSDGFIMASFLMRQWLALGGCYSVGAYVVGSPCLSPKSPWLRSDLGAIVCPCSP